MTARSEGVSLLKIVLFVPTKAKFSLARAEPGARKQLMASQPKNVIMHLF